MNPKTFGSDRLGITVIVAHSGEINLFMNKADQIQKVISDLASGVNPASHYLAELLTEAGEYVAANS